MNFILTQTSPNGLAISFMYKGCIHNVDLATLNNIHIDHEPAMLATLNADFVKDMQVKDITAFVIICKDTDATNSLHSFTSFIADEFPAVMMETVAEYGYKVGLHLNGVIQMVLSDEELDMETIRVPAELTTVGIVNQDTLSIWTSGWDTSPLLEVLNVAADENHEMCPVIELAALAVANLQLPTFEEEVITLVLVNTSSHSTVLNHITFTSSLSWVEQAKLMSSLFMQVNTVNGGAIKKMKAISQLTTLS